MPLNYEEAYHFTLKRSTKKRTLASGNEVISSNDRLFHHVKAELTAHLRALSGQETPTHFYDEENPCFVLVEVHPPTKRRMDPPNFYPTVKALLDGLTDAGQWSDDNSKVIDCLSFRPGKLSGVKGHYTFSIYIYPAKEDIYATS